MISQGLVETEYEDPGFEIIHLSFRKRESSHLYGGPVNYYIGNIVFRLTNEDAKGRMEYIMRENPHKSCSQGQHPSQTSLRHSTHTLLQQIGDSCPTRCPMAR